MDREFGYGHVSRPSYIGGSNWLFEGSTVTKWTPEENKRFENALAQFDKDTPDRWHNVASMIPGKTVADVIRQYQELVEDVSDIEAGLIPIPGYAAAAGAGDSFTLEWVNNHGLKQVYCPGGGKRRCSDPERKKGVPWTEEEHRQFLLGLKKYGKGDWRNISRNFVTTRTPTQVASHAQKYFIRQLSGGKDKRRSSIHDITTVNLDETMNSSSMDKVHSDSSLQKPGFIMQGHQNLDVVVRATYGSHMGNTDDVTGFSPPCSCGSLMISHFQGSSSLGVNVNEQLMDPYGLWLGHHATIFQMYPTQHT